MKYKVTIFHSVHNHPVNPHLAKHYPKTRQLSSKEEIQVNNMINRRMGTNELKDYAKQLSGKQLTSCDIHNLRAKVRKDQAAGRTKEEVLVDNIRDIQDKFPGATTEIVTDESTNEFVLMYVQTRIMKELVDKFSDVLFIDGTYNVNAEGYPLYPFLIEDGSGKGKPIAFVYVKDETHQTFLQSF